MFSKIVYFSNSRIDSSAIEFKVQKLNDIKTTILSVRKPNGANGTITIIESSHGISVEGEWTTWNEYYILLTAEYFIEGAATIHYDVYKSENAYLNGNSPLLSADYYLSPDKTGEGTLTVENIIYKINFNRYGKAIVSNDGKSKEINLYH